MPTIKILGTGCAKCEKAAKAAAEAVEKMNIDCEIEKVSGVAEIMAYGVMMTPAVVIDEELKQSGKVPTVADFEGWLS